MVGRGDKRKVVKTDTIAACSRQDKGGNDLTILTVSMLTVTIFLINLTIYCLSSSRFELLMMPKRLSTEIL